MSVRGDNDEDELSSLKYHVLLKTDKGRLED